MFDPTNDLLSEQGNIIPINISDEMRSAYIDYSMSVIISRALPDVRDGLKPVHRRILYGMYELGTAYNRPFKKCARIVGDVLGKYHPHGDTAVYETMVRMAQEWSMRYTLVDGQGNFGSIDGDSPAAMRYTEARLKKISDELLKDIKKNTVDFQPNYDDSTSEPRVLPANLPNLLINGSSGIAVGMATNIAPHNLSETIAGIHAYINNNDITIDELMQHIKAPDFPTGATIYGYKGVKEAFHTGRGRVILRAKASIEEISNGKEQIIVTEIPYQVNKAFMIEKTAHLISEKSIEGIADIRDESDKQGLRIVYELKRDAIPNIVLNNLYKQTALQSSFSVNNVALVKGRPKLINLKELIVHFVDHRHDVIVRRTQFELEEAEKRAHVLEGYLIALDNLDEVISLIRSSEDPEKAKIGLMSNFKLSEIQAKAILDMRLQRLTGLEREKIVSEYEEIVEQIKYLKVLLGDRSLRMEIVKDELSEVNKQYGDERRSYIEHYADDLTEEDMIPDDEMVITVSHEGYIKKTPLDEYKTQARGGVGSRAANSKSNDFTEDIFVATNHNYLLFFTKLGKVFWKKVWELLEGKKNSKGRPIQNLINLDPEDKVVSIINVKTLNEEEYINNNYIIMCTQNGVIKKTLLEQYSRPRRNGINAITINENDRLLTTKLTNGDNHIIMASDAGKAINFHESQVRSVGRMGSGVRGMLINKATEKIIGMVCVDINEHTELLVVSENGYGKRSSIGNYRIIKRGGKGVKTLNITEKTGKLMAIENVKDEDELIIINKSGIAIRLAISDIRVKGRATQGVRLIKIGEDDTISAVEKIPYLEGEEETTETPEKKETPS